MSTLIFGTSYIKDARDLWMVRQWVHLNRVLNPQADLLIVDSASPVLPPEGVEVLQLGDNIGHMFRGGRDGWGRAFCAGLSRAKDYDWVVSMETDLLFARPVDGMLDRMWRTGVEVSAPWAMPYWFMEVGLLFMSGRFVCDNNLARLYDWEHGEGVPELRIEKLVEPHWFVAPLRGMRDEKGDGPANVEWITHATVVKVRAFLAANGLSEAPVEGV